VFHQIKALYNPGNGLSERVKVFRKLKAKVDDLAVSDRSVRHYIQALKTRDQFQTVSLL
jgi:hypothetical protein